MGTLMEKNNQDQRSGDNSTNVQAGGNVTIVGVTYNEVRQIAADVFKANFLTLQGSPKYRAATSRGNNHSLLR